MKKNFLILLMLLLAAFFGGVAEAADVVPVRGIEARLSRADKLVRGYFYDEALKLLQSIPMPPGGVSPDPRVLEKIDRVKAAKRSLVKYTGPAHHVFFHSLIVYPELAFDKKGHSAAGYNMWMTTVDEFKKMLPLLMERGYVLYSLADYAEGDIMLPPGKIPLVLSVDDVNYYDYMKIDGFARKLVLEGGKVCTEVVTPQGEVVVTRDGDVFPILDDFVEEHPEFSWRGAKGVLALTGFQGALGYRIRPEYPFEKNAEATEQAKEVADALKRDGWLFACHSYTHNQFFRNGSMSMSKLQYDTEKWQKFIEPVTGKTNIYISPFGVSLIFQPNAYSKYLIENGFNIFCPVSDRLTITRRDGYIVMGRVNLDGYKMSTGKKFLEEHYFDVAAVIDPARPKLK